MEMTNLPPEMQERLAQIVAQAQQAAQPAPPPARPPSLMDHTIALRQEVAALTNKLDAMAQVTEAVGQAVGQLYAMFHEQTSVTDQGAAYQAPNEEDF